MPCGWFVYAALAGVEHLEAQDVEVLRRPCADDLGEARDANAHELTLGALRSLLLAELGITDLVHRELERAAIVARVVLPPKRRGVREGRRRDEVLHPQLGRVLLDLEREHVDEPLDGEGSLGDA